MAKFKTRARAVDMLGRQQIAGIPSAISELFKNAHDAYATRVEVDYYRSDRLFVLRDNGLGMTRDDFESRWLTLGTESKMGQESGMALPPSDPNQQQRPILGEKGIGRLAIAAIGPHVLILSRAKRQDKLHDIVIAYIHWRIFEMPGLDLDDIEIPIRTYANGTFPTKEDVAEMLSDFKGNIKKCKYINSQEINSFNEDFESICLDPAEVDQYVPNMSLTKEGHGTHFIILPAYEILEADIDSSDEEKASPLDKALLGFTNQMTPDHEIPAIKAAFRDHKDLDDFEDLISERQFFTPNEFTNADHHFQGRFNEYGQFNGTVSIYKGNAIPYKIQWNGSKGKMTQCGPFSINIAYVQGQPDQTTVSFDDYNQLIDKTNRIGGLYIYKNGIRILPYGDSDFDWLDVEKRRTLKAGRWFFSYRRMFGVIEIDQIKNSNLNEKAGREGFRENKAYREFRSILVSMFKQLATEFFTKEGIYADDFFERRDELERYANALKKREASTIEKRKKLSQDLKAFLEAYRNKVPEKEAIELASELQNSLNKLSTISESSDAAYHILNIEARSRQQLRELDDKYRIIKPKGIGFNKKTEREFEDYSIAYRKLQTSVFSIVRELVEGEVTQAATRARIELDRRVRIERALNDLANQAKNVARNERKETIETLETLEGEVRSVVKDSIIAINEEVQNVLTIFNSMDFAKMEESTVAEARDNLESRIIQIKEKKQDFLRIIRAQLEAVNLSDDISQLDQIEALEQRNIALEERSDMDLQLTQLGMAIEVINHEFDSSIKSIRHDLRRLQGWADLNKNLSGVYQGLRNSFDHLDGYLTLFTPLHRRLYRKEIPITGLEISEYIKSLFKQRFERHAIIVRTTNSFNKHKIIGYPSSFYPVFVNIIDNAIFWLKDKNGERIIELDVMDNSFLISNNGPEILESRYEYIFESGVSYKPGGRGLGLAISRQVLEKIGYDLSLDVEPHKSMTVAFRISPKSNL